MTVLVTGARGGIGSRLVATLAAAGHAVRGTTREQLDLADPDPAAAKHALDGVEAVFLYPVRGSIARFLDAVQDSGVRYVVLLSSPASYAAHEHDRHIGRVHRALERSLEETGLPHTLLYPSWLASNAARDWAGRIRADAAVALPFPDAQFTPIHLDDVAEVAADLLTREDHRARVQVLTGPRSLRLREIVEIIGEVTGRSLRIETVTREQALANRAPWMPEAVLETLLHVEAAAVGVTAPVNNAVERITGHPALTFRAWVEAHREVFLPPSGK